MCEKSKRKLKNQLAQCSETIQAALNKTRPITPETLDKLTYEGEDTYIPE